MGKKLPSHFLASNFLEPILLQSNFFYRQLSSASGSGPDVTVTVGVGVDTNKVWTTVDEKFLSVALDSSLVQVQVQVDWVVGATARSK